jgi:hypothetical protein
VIEDRTEFILRLHPKVPSATSMTRTAATAACLAKSFSPG